MLYDLAANPLLLTMIANVHRYRGALPGSRAELYSEICQVLLWRRQEAKNVAVPQEEASGPKKEIVLREVAFRMMRSRRRDIGADHAAELLAPILSRVAVTAPQETFLNSVVASGLLVEREHGQYAFAHLTLQEHLAARHIGHHRLIGVLTKAVDDDWWRETTLLFAARTDPAPVIEACLASGSTRALALAFDCAGQATELAPGTAHRLETLRREALLEPPGSARHRLVAAATVTRHLRETIRLDNDTLIATRPVPAEVYRLFALGTGAPAPRHLARLADDAPATGMTRQDAVAFVRWLNELLPDDTVYRIPTHADVTDPAFRLTAHSPQHTVWHTASDPEALPLLWAPPTAGRTPTPAASRIPATGPTRRATRSSRSDC